MTCSGSALLSAYPISDVTFQGGPSRLFATIATPSGPVRVVVVHPLPGSFVRGPFDDAD